MFSLEACSVDDRIAHLISLEHELTNAEQNELDQRLAARREYAYRIEDLGIAAIKEQHEAERKATKAQKKELEKRAKAEEKAEKERIAAMKKVNQDYADAIRERYDAELKAAEDAANAEIKIYSDKIKAIDDLLKAESRAESDASDQDVIDRLKIQLAYEHDESNIYELNKEIAQKQAEMEKRQRRESLEDQKSALQEQMNAVRENLAAQKQAISEARDAEVAAEEERQAQYAASLEAQTTMLRETEAEKTVIVGESLDAQAAKLTETETANTGVVQDTLKTRTKDNQKFLGDKEKQLEQNLRNERQSYSRAIDNIIADLYARLPNFAAAGTALGNAFAVAYREAIAALDAANRESQGSQGLGASPSRMALALEEEPSGDTYYIDFDQTITMPVASPSKISSETEDTLEQLLRYL